ncbi:hypothetical protein [Demequina rhizosphaerae]|uniref:hypothetical protein n=1 Tax=Demequina rhizosphaerae TaxID=1638985 RepID=UPI000780B412|nr:hypothetical protein [Demequina rhizosphaerae]
MDDSYNDRMAAEARLHHEQMARLHHQQAVDDAALAAGVAQPFAFLRHRGAGAAGDVPVASAIRVVGAVLATARIVFGLAFAGMFLYLFLSIMGSWDAAPGSGDTVLIETDDGTVVAP